MDITRDIKECDAFVFLTKIVSEMNDAYYEIAGYWPFSVSISPSTSGMAFYIRNSGQKVQEYTLPVDDTEVGRKVFLQKLEKELDSLFSDTAQELKGYLNAKNLVNSLNKKVAQ